MAKLAETVDHGLSDDIDPSLQHLLPKHRPQLSLLEPVRQKNKSPLTPEEQLALKERFFRDAEIGSQLSSIMMNLAPGVIQGLEVMIQAQHNGRPYDQENLDLFCIDSREIFSALDRLGVTILPMPEGRASFEECTAEDFLPMYRVLYSHRTEFQQGLFPIQGVAPLSVRPRQSWNEPHWDISESNQLQDFVAHELPGYDPDAQSYKASSRPFQNLIMRVLENSKREYQPHPQEAQEFLHYLQRDVLPGFQRAVTHYTAWHSMNLYGPMTLPDQDLTTLPLLRTLYDTHDSAVTVITDLDTLALHGRRQLPKRLSFPLSLLNGLGENRNEQPLARAMNEVRTKLKQFHVLNIA